MGGISYPIRHGALSAEIDRRYAGLDVPGRPGAIVALLDGGELVHLAGYGRANAEFDIPWTADTRYPVASMTKLMVADVVLGLVDAGLLDLDAPVGARMPALGPGLAALTLRQLLTMTSGLRHDEVIAWLLGVTNWSNAYLEALVDRPGAHQFAAGGAQLYCCANFRLVARLLAHVLGASFADVMRTRLFEPLGMADSSAFPAWNCIEPRRASCYAPPAGNSSGPSWAREAGAGVDAAAYRRIWETGESSGDGAVVSTIADLILLARHLRQIDATGASRWARLADGAPAALGPAARYGLGVQIDRLDGATVWGHAGGTNVRMAHLPDRDLTVICLHNDMGRRAETAAFELLRLAAGPVPKAAAPEGWLPMAGLYADPASGWILELSVEGSDLHVRVQGERPTLAERVGPGHWRAARWFIPFELRAASGSPTIEALLLGTFAVRLQQAPQAHVSDLGVYAGRYAAEGFEGAVAVEASGDGLVLRLGQGATPAQRLPLTPIGDGLFHHDGLGVSFDLAGGRASRLRLHHALARDVGFTRIGLEEHRA